MVLQRGDRGYVCVCIHPHRGYVCAYVGICVCVWGYVCVYVCPEIYCLELAHLNMGRERSRQQSCWCVFQSQCQGRRRPVSPFEDRQRENSILLSFVFDAGPGWIGWVPRPGEGICIMSPTLQLLTSSGNTQNKVGPDIWASPWPVKLTHEVLSHRLHIS